MLNRIAFSTIINLKTIFNFFLNSKCHISVRIATDQFKKIEAKTSVQTRVKATNHYSNF